MAAKPRNARLTLLVPLGCYAAVTLGLPALHGALARPDFLRHAGFVVVGIAMLVGPALAFSLLTRLLRTGSQNRKRGQPDKPPSSSSGRVKWLPDVDSNHGHGSHRSGLRSSEIAEGK